MEVAELMPIFLVNQTSKTVKMKKVGGVRKGHTSEEVMAKENEKVLGPDRVKAKVKELLRGNQDVMARLDKELGQTSTAKM